MIINNKYIINYLVNNVIYIILGFMGLSD